MGSQPGVSNLCECPPKMGWQEVVLPPKVCRTSANVCRTSCKFTRHMIGADQIKQRRTPKPVEIIADGINGEGNPSALQFLHVDLAIALAGQRQPQQAQSLFRR